jgi:hypothetical protein
VTINRRGVSGRIVYATFRGSAGKRRMHGWAEIRSVLGLYDAPSTIKKITSRASTARAAAAGTASYALAHDVSGTISPGRAGDRVIVQRRSGGRWKRVARGRLGRSGAYRVPVESSGLYRVVSAGDAGPTLRVR